MNEDDKKDVMKKKMELKLRKIERAYKLRVMPHQMLPYAVNSYMIGDRTGLLIGGNREEYITCSKAGSWYNIPRNCFPKIYKNAGEARRMIASGQISSAVNNSIRDRKMDEVREFYREVYGI